MSDSLKSLVLADLCRFDKKTYNEHDLFDKQDLFLQDLKSDEVHSSRRIVNGLRQYANFGLIVNDKYDTCNGSLEGLPVDFLIFKKDSRIYFPEHGIFRKGESNAVSFLSNGKFTNLVGAVKSHFDEYSNGGLVVIGSKKRDLKLLDDAYLIADFESKRKVVSAAMKSGFVNRQQDIGGLRHMLNGAYDYVRSYNTIFENNLKR